MTIYDSWDKLKTKCLSTFTEDEFRDLERIMNDEKSRRKEIKRKELAEKVRALIAEIDDAGYDINDFL